MQINLFRFILFILIITTIQQIVNSSTPLYIDCIGLVLVILLITNTEYHIRFLIILSIFADLVGHWYFGTHLLAITILSFISKYVVDFYKICNNLQKTIICGVFYAILLLIIGASGVITHNSYFSWISFTFEIFIVTPIILWLFHSFIIRIPPNIIRMDN